MIGALIYGVIVGSAAKGIGGLLGSSQIRSIIVHLGGKSALTNAYLAAIMGFNGLIAAGYAVSAVLRLRSEETSGHADPVLATTASRVRWGLSHLLIAFARHGADPGDGRPGRRARLRAAFRRNRRDRPARRRRARSASRGAGDRRDRRRVLRPASPRPASRRGWSALGIAVLMLFLGAALKLSHWILDISPFQHLPKLPGGTVTAPPLIWLSVIALALGLAGLLACADATSADRWRRPCG